MRFTFCKTSPLPTCWIARFDSDGCIAALERARPDYCGLHVSLHDLLLPHEAELVPAGSVQYT